MSLLLEHRAGIWPRMPQEIEKQDRDPVILEKQVEIT
jgi:hypothetical protein